MAKTAVLPSSVMTSIRRPRSVIAPLGWTQLPGGAIVVAASPDGSIWVLSSIGSGPDRSIWHYVNGSWTNIPGAAMRIAVAPDGAPWVVNSAGSIYHFDGVNWVPIAGGASDISVGPDGTVYIVSNQGGNQYGRGLWQYTNGVWSQLPGAGVRIAAAWERIPQPRGIVPGGVWVVNAQNHIFYFVPGSGYVEISGGIVEIAPTMLGGIFGLGYIANPDGSYPIYYHDLATSTWTQQTGSAVSIATNTANVYVVGVGGGIYMAPVLPGQVTPASFTITGPTDPHVSGSQSSGFQLIGNQPYPFKITAFDSAGNQISDANLPPITVTSNSGALVVSALDMKGATIAVRAQRFTTAPLTLTITTPVPGATASLTVNFAVVQELWVANSYNSTITAYAGSPPAQIASDTITGLLGPSGIAFDAGGNMWVSTYSNVVGLVGTKQPAFTISSGLVGPVALAFDANSILWVADFGAQNGVGLIDAYSGTTQLNAYTISNPAASITGLMGPRGLAFDNNGRLWVANGNFNANTVTAYAGAAQQPLSTIRDSIHGPSGLAFDGSGTLWVANANNNTVTAYTGNTQLLADTISDGLKLPMGMAFDGSGRLWVANNWTGVGGSYIACFSGTTQLPQNTVTTGVVGPIGITFAPPATLPPAPPNVNFGPVIPSPYSVALSGVAGLYNQTVTISQAGYSGPFVASVDNTAVALANVSGNTVTLTPVDVGTTMLRITGAGGHVADVPISVSSALGTLVVSPASLAFNNVGAAYSQTVSVSEPGYGGTFAISGINSLVATASISGSSITVTPVSAGNTSLHVAGGNAYLDIPIGVTVSEITIQSKRRGVR
jgi:sugar lactone lactonase YvrE